MINYKFISGGILKALFTLAVIFLVLLFVFKIQTLIIHFFMALALTLITDPVVSFLHKKWKFPNTMAVIIILMIVMFAMIGFIMLFVPLIVTQATNLSLLDTVALERSIMKLFERTDQYILGYNIDIKELLLKFNLSSHFNFSFIPFILNTTINLISNLGIAVLTIFFMTFFFLKDKYLFIKNVKYLLPKQHQKKIISSIYKTNSLLSRYFIGLIIQLMILFVLYFIVLIIFDVQNAFIIAFLSALLNIIPFLGPLISCILVCLLTMMGGIGTGDFSQIVYTTLYVFISYMVIHLLDSNINQPIIFSNSIKSHPLEVFVVILACGYLFGIPGMIVAIPIYSTMKVVAKEFFPNCSLVKILTKNI